MSFLRRSEHMGDTITVYHADHTFTHRHTHVHVDSGGVGPAARVGDEGSRGIGCGEFHCTPLYAARAPSEEAFTRCGHAARVAVRLRAAARVAGRWRRRGRCGGDGDGAANEGGGGEGGGPGESDDGGDGGGEGVTETQRWW